MKCRKYQQDMEDFTVVLRKAKSFRNQNRIRNIYYMLDTVTMSKEEPSWLRSYVSWIYNYL